MVGRVTGVSRELHQENLSCRYADAEVYGYSPCHFVVEQHQDPPETDVPEFEIEIRYITTRGYGDENQRRPGWKYTVTWGAKGADGGLNYARGWGYATKLKAKEAAETEAKAIALSLLPTERYTYNPLEN